MGERNRIKTNIIQNQLFVEVYLSSKPLVFLFDTGAQISCLRQSCLQFADKKTYVKSVKAGGTAGKVSQINESIGGGQKLARLDGLLGWDIISRYRWDFDKNKNLLSVAGGRVENSLNNLSWNVFALIDITLNGHGCVAAFDSGHTESMLAPSALNFVKGVSSVTPVIDRSVGFDGVSEEKALCVGEAEVGIASAVIKLTNILLYERPLYAIADKNIVGLLGADIFKNKSWTLDFPCANFCCIRKDGNNCR